MRSNTRTIYKGDIDDAAVAHIASIQAVANEIEARRIELKKNKRLRAIIRKSHSSLFWWHGPSFYPTETGTAARAHLVYVVGDQASFFQVMIRTGQLLAEVAESVGFKLKEIQLFRSRLSTATKQYLREEAVVLEWQGDRTHVSMNGHANTMPDPKPTPEEPKTNGTAKSSRRSFVPRILRRRRKFASNEPTSKKWRRNSL